MSITGYLGLKSAITLPTNIDSKVVTGIESNAFKNSLSLASVIIPSTVTSIGTDAFRSCSNLVNIVIPSNVTHLGSGVFKGCASLQGCYFKGDAPVIDSSLFDAANSNKTVIYYLSGTSGWGPAFGGGFSQPWNPKAQLNDGSFGVGADGFGFNIAGYSNMIVVVEACTNLAGSVWSTLETNTLVGGTAYFNDPRSTNYTGRFYRFRMP